MDCDKKLNISATSIPRVKTPPGRQKKHHRKQLLEPGVDKNHAGMPWKVPPSQEDTVEAWHRRIGRLDPRQIVAWRAMTPAQRLDLACQAYRLVLERYDGFATPRRSMVELSTSFLPRCSLCR